jgi:hypothetical protein
MFLLWTEVNKYKGPISCSMHFRRLLKNRFLHNNLMVVFEINDKRQGNMEEHVWKKAYLRYRLDTPFKICSKMYFIPTKARHRNEENADIFIHMSFFKINPVIYYTRDVGKCSSSSPSSHPPNNWQPASPKSRPQIYNTSDVSVKCIVQAFETGIGLISEPCVRHPGGPPGTYPTP